MEAQETKHNSETGIEKDHIVDNENETTLNQDETTMDVTNTATGDEEPSTTSLPISGENENNKEVVAGENTELQTEQNHDEGTHDSETLPPETMNEDEAKPNEDSTEAPANNNTDITTLNSRFSGEKPTPPLSKSSPKKTSPKERTKLPPIASSAPFKYPALGIGENVYHPSHTPRRQLRPFGMRQNNLSSFSSPQIDTQQHNQNFQPDINSLSGQYNNSRYEDSIADSGFSSQVVNHPPPILIQQEDDEEDQFEGVPVPYQSQKFKSSTVMRMVTVPKRNQDMFGKERCHNKNRGMAFHTGRYNYLESMTEGFDRSPSQLSQRDRLLLETAHLEKLRNIRRELGTNAPHRLSLNLAMGGSKVEFFDRVDIPMELRELKNISLPSHARDLYIGRGIALPEGHALNRPRRLRPLT